METNTWKSQLNDAPYCIAADIALLDDGAADTLSAEELSLLRRRVAMCVDDRDALERLLGTSDIDMEGFYPDTRTPRPTTNETIDTFLDTYCKTSDKETDLLTRMIFTPGVPAMGMDWNPDLIGRDEPEPAQNSQSTQSSQSTQITPITPITPIQETAAKVSASKQSSSKQPASESPLTLSLARIMIKNGNYRKALEIISQLSLSKPENLTYFADQIRFLKKLIVNQEKKQEPTKQSSC